MENFRPNIEDEIDEIQRTSQDLSRDEGINVSVSDIVEAFNESEEETLKHSIWSKLENTESNKIKKGDIEAVNKIAEMYHKTNPKILVRSIKSGDYDRPLILNLNNRYILVAGNTRLCTSAALGVLPKVFIGKIVNMTKKDLEEMVMKNNTSCCKGKETETTEQTTAGDAGSFEGPVFSDVIKRPISKIHNSTIKEEEEVDEATDASSSGSFDVPLFGKTTKGGRRDPLKIDGPSSISQSRAVKDKKFPKWGGPKGVYIKVKEKCKKFPYCNQGDINAIELLEIEGLKETIIESSKKYGIPYKEIEKIVLNDIKEIFIEI